MKIGRRVFDARQRMRFRGSRQRYGHRAENRQNHGRSRHLRAGIGFLEVLQAQGWTFNPGGGSPMAAAMRRTFGSQVHQKLGTRETIAPEERCQNQHGEN